MSRVNPGYAWALGLAGTGMALLTIPDVIEHLAARGAGNMFDRIQRSIVPQEGVFRQAEFVNEKDLLAQLTVGDQQWIPHEETLSDGSKRYLYKRRADEEDLSIAELKQMIESPPTFDQERERILSLLQALRDVGVRVTLSETIKKGAAAEWDHKSGTLRIQPNMTAKGSVDFLRVLNHEATHVAQSCMGGSLRALPKVLGISLEKPQELKKKLDDPVYADTSPWEKSLEMEAYAIQDDSEKVRQLVDNTCRLLSIDVPDQIKTFA